MISQLVLRRRLYPLRLLRVLLISLLVLLLVLRFKGKWFSVMAEKYCRKILTRKLVEMYTVRGDFLRLKSSAEKYCLAQVSREWANTKLFQISKQSAYQKVIYIELDSKKSFRCLCFGGSWPFDDEDIWRWNIRVFL